MATETRRPVGQRGATLLDLLLVVVILGILAATAVQSFDTGELALDAAARATAADLQRAQSLAIETRTPFGLRFDPANNRSFFVLGNGTTPTAAEATLRGNAALSATDTGRLLAARASGDPRFSGVTLHDADFGGGSQVTFSPDGSPASDGVVEFRVGSRWLRVRVQQASGRITITAP